MLTSERGPASGSGGGRPEGRARGLRTDQEAQDAFVAAPGFEVKP